jgi:hypothetical protein
VEEKRKNHIIFLLEKTCFPQKTTIKQHITKNKAPKKEKMQEN